ncbi:CNGA3-like protein [Mya arenaria]|uniref:CNGA3-like protein n=1 Tax=Mya arenaria TaxID=6604 RepID=A0ABY7DXJ1_MYAAR|nr:CNGA3-like protein [Mya arenaria]
MSATSSPQKSDLDLKSAKDRWSKLKTSMNAANNINAKKHRRLSRGDSFLRKFSTRNQSEAQTSNETEEDQVYKFQIQKHKTFKSLVVHPSGGVMFYWLGIVTLAVLYNIWTCIAREAFREIQRGYMYIWFLFDGLCDFVYVCDIFVQFRTGYLNQGLMVYDSRKLCKNYTKDKCFIVDIICLLPLDFLQFYTGIHPMLRFPRFLKIYRGIRFMHMYESRTAYPNLLRVASLTHILFLGSHWFAAFYYLISEAEHFEGQVGNVITNRNASRQEFERLLDGAKFYMQMHNVPTELQKRVQRWYDYVWTRGRLNCNDINSLGLLPDKLKTELALHVNLGTLKKVTIFQKCRPEFLHDLMLKMRAYIFTPGDLICRRGEVAREMFIIADGVVEILGENGAVLTQMSTGDFFGEIGILNIDGGINRRTADVRSVGYSELFVLSREDVLSALKDHPDAEEIITSYALSRLEQVRAHRSESSETVNSLRTSLEHLASISEMSSESTQQSLDE